MDIGKLANEWIEEKSNFNSQKDFLLSKAYQDLKQNTKIESQETLFLYGFGRIGRLAARELIKQAGKGQQLRLRAIVTRGDSETDIIKRAFVLKK